MKFIILFGPPAVGKMTVGLELEKATGIKLFHNHATIELVLNFFDYGMNAFKRLVHSFRMQIFEEVANSDLPGMTFTYVWDLDGEGDYTFIREACTIFEKAGADIYIVELSADLEERLIRNKTELRLKEKPSKRNVERSEANLLDLHNKLRLNTAEEEDLGFPYKHIRIDTTKLEASQTAEVIIEALNL